MGYKCSFMDSSIYTAQDVNDALSHITSEGVAVFSDTNDTLSDLNDALSEISEGGAVGDGCRVVKENDKYIIKSGVCFMKDGSQIAFDEDGYEITPEADTYNYVYLERNVFGNNIDIVVSETEGGNNVIPLAEIDEEGEILDTRVFAHAKIPLSTGNSVKEMHIECTPYETNGYTVNVGWENFSRIILPEVSGRDYEISINVSDGQEHRIPYRTEVYDFHEIILVRKSGKYLIFRQAALSYGIDLDIEVM